MGRGRPPVPAKLKVLHGNPGKRDIPDEPSLPRGWPPKPDDIGEHGLQAWNDAARLLDELGILTPAEGPLLRLYAQAADGYHQAREAIETTGIVLVSQNQKGQTDVRRNPFSVELHKYREAQYKLLIELGLTPIARARLGLSDQRSDNDPAAEFIA